MTSIVSQNAPAFFERTNTARSAIVAMGSDLLEFGTEEAGRGVRHKHVVEMEFIDRAAVELGRRIGEGDARYEAVPFRDRVVHREMRDARRNRVRQLLRVADHVPQDEDLVAADLR